MKNSGVIAWLFTGLAAKMRYSYKEIRSLDGLRLKRPPHQGEIAAAHLLTKQINEGKRPGEEITPFLRWWLTTARRASKLRPWSLRTRTAKTTP